MSALNDALRDIDLSERIRARRPDLADALLGRAIAVVGDELARRDSLVRSMLDLDAELARLAVAALAPSEKVAVLARREGEDG